MAGEDVQVTNGSPEVFAEINIGKVKSCRFAGMILRLTLTNQDISGKLPLVLCKESSVSKKKINASSEPLSNVESAVCKLRRDISSLHRGISRLAGHSQDETIKGLLVAASYFAKWKRENDIEQQAEDLKTLSRILGRLVRENNQAKTPNRRLSLALIGYIMKLFQLTNIMSWIIKDDVGGVSVNSVNHLVVMDARASIDRARKENLKQDSPELERWIVGLDRQVRQMCAFLDYVY